MLLVLQCQILWQCCAAQLHCLCAVIQPYNSAFLLVSSHIESSVRLVRLGRKRVKTPFKAPWNNSAHSQCTEKKLTSIGNQEEWSRDRRVRLIFSLVHPTTSGDFQESDSDSTIV
ncbi:hypothetical protein B0H13DRAFT_1918504 [Mycena leptocephala]|nr:hypothetical protein B0H13DRAFT_1918504 [Mycena leptocephala]